MVLCKRAGSVCQIYSCILNFYRCISFVIDFTSNMWYLPRIFQFFPLLFVMYVHSKVSRDADIYHILLIPSLLNDRQQEADSHICVLFSYMSHCTFLVPTQAFPIPQCVLLSRYGPSIQAVLIYPS